MLSSLVIKDLEKFPVELFDRLESAGFTVDDILLASRYASEMFSYFDDSGKIKYMPNPVFKVNPEEVNKAGLLSRGYPLDLVNWMVNRKPK